MCAQSFSHVQLFVISWTAAHQDPLSMGFPSQEYWSELPFPSPGDLPHPGIKPESPILAGGFFTTEPPGSPMSMLHSLKTAANAEICRNSTKHKMQQWCLPLSMSKLDHRECRPAIKGLTHKMS